MAWFPNKSGGGEPERIEVRPPPPEDDEQVTLVVSATEASFTAILKGFKLQVSKSVTTGAAREGILVAAAVVAYNLLPGQHMTVLVVAVLLSPAVIVGSGVLPASIRRRARG